ncbi:MAG TPA: HAD hydrolase-like protein, partial [Desulfitobacteriaceae bacterium]|nr:HAD hydrolase-like protein [Desulfitobacteriaceae bacterium]
MKRFDTILFDLDGTLLNTLADIADSVNIALTQYGYPSRDMFEIRSFVGYGAARLMELSVPDGLNSPYYEKCLVAFRKHYAENMRNKTGVYKGIMELLGQLSKHGYKIAIVSNKSDTETKKLTKDYFKEN